MRRSEWFDDLARSLINILPPGRRPFLRALTLPGEDDFAETVALLHGTLIAQVCVEYRNAFSANQIADRLKASALCPEHVTAVDLMDQLIRPLFAGYRTGRLPLDRWWSAEAHFLLLLPWYTRQRLQNVGRQTMDDELRDLWELSNASREIILREAESPLPQVPVLLATPAAGSELAAIWRAADIQSALADELVRIPVRIMIHDELREAVTAAARLRVILARPDAFLPVISNPAGLVTELEVVLDQFSAYELSLIREPTEDDRRLAASIDARRKVQFHSGVGPNAVADGRIDQLLVPAWMTEYIVSAGGRIGHRACGPIAYWFVALDGIDVPDEVETGATFEGLELASHEPSHGIAEFVLPFTIRGEPRTATFHFPDSLGDAMELALVAITGTIRIDIFLLGRDGLLELVSSGQYRVADSPLATIAREAALRVLRRFPGEPDDLLNAWSQEHAEERPINGFLASDWAKAEELLDLSAADYAVEATTEGLSELAAARHRWLSLEHTLASRQLESVSHAALEHDVAQARADYVFARGNVSGRTREDPEPLRLDRLVTGVVDEDRAFVHLNRTQDHLDAFICTATADGPAVERLDVSGTPLLDVENAITAWHEGEPSSLVEVMKAVGSELGRAVSAHLAGSTVSHLFISPVSVLHAVPMCLLDTGSGQLLGDEYSISYAPSARLLQWLAALGQVTGLDLVATAYHDEADIPLTSAEIELVGSLYKDPTLLTAENATPLGLMDAMRSGTVVHAACHGTWRLGNTYASGLHLAPSPGDAGYLSVAKLHRDADLGSVRLVVLSACDTGRSRSSWPQIQNYLSIDGAFLACGARAVVSSLWEVDDLAGLLFSLELHQHLTTGADVQAAFSAATEFLRSGAYARLDESSPEAQQLDSGWPDWRQEVDEMGTEFTDPYYWAVFKLSGVAH